MSAAEFPGAFPAETDFVERKLGIGVGPLQRALVAFSNSEGGVLLIGVADDGQVVGKPATQGVITAIHESAEAAHDPGRYRIHELVVEGIPITVVSVERRSQGFSQTSDGQVLVRRGGRSTPLIGGDLRRFISERALERFDVTDSGVDVSQADPELLAEIQHSFRWRSLPDAGRLSEHGLAVLTGSGAHLTVAGALTLLAEPERHLGKVSVEVLRFPSEGSEYDRRVEVHGPVQRLVADAVGILLDELGTDVVVSGLRRYELPRLPEVVLRETIANAVAHRSYEDVGRSIRVEEHVDRVVVISPGGLPEPVTEQNIRETQSARNSAVLGILRRLRLAEDLGRGVDVIQDSMAEALLDPPVFQDLDHSVRVTLPIRGAVSPQERAWVMEIEGRGVIRPVDRLLLLQAVRGEELTNARVRELLSVDSRDAQAALRRLRDAGFLQQIGERGGATYVIARSIAAPPSFRLTPTELGSLVLDLARAGPISNADVRAATGLDRVASLRLLDALIETGRLRRIGQKRGTRYVPTRRVRRGG